MHTLYIHGKIVGQIFQPIGMLKIRIAFSGHSDIQMILGILD